MIPPSPPLAARTPPPPEGVDRRPTATGPTIRTFWRCYQRARDRGFTLIELVVSLVILGIAASLITLGVTSSAKHTADPVVQEQAVAIADAYLQEILQKGFCDPDDTSFGIVGGLSHCRPNPSWAGCTASICGGTCGGNGANSLTPEASRTSYDDICDYNGLSQSPRDQNDTPLPGLSLYTATIAVVGDATAIVGALVGTNGQTARVDVTVSHPALPAPVVVSGYRVNY